MDDAERFRKLFESSYEPIRRYLRHRGVDFGRADDLVAETFVVAWRRLADVPPDDPLPWLMAVARNLWLNERRSGRRREAFVSRLPRPRPEPPAEPSDPAERAAVRASLGALSSDDRELLLLVAWDELTPTQAASVIGCTPAVARTRLYRARARFADELARRGGLSGQVHDENQLLPGGER